LNPQKYGDLGTSWAVGATEKKKEVEPKDLPINGMILLRNVVASWSSGY